MKNFKYYLFVFLISVIDLSFSQGNNQIGIFGGAGLTFHSGNFLTREGDFACNSFEKGTGSNILFGIQTFFPIYPDFRLSPRLSYQNIKGKFNDNLRFPFLGLNNQIEEVTLEDELNISLNTLNLNISLCYDLNESFYLLLGPSINLLLSNNYKLKEKIASPEGVKFLDGSREKQIFDGDMNTTKAFFVELTGGVGFNFTLFEALKLNSEITYSHSLTKVSKEDDWNISKLQATIGLAFDFNIDRSTYTRECRCKLDNEQDGFYIGPAGLIPYAFGFKGEYRKSDISYILSAQYIPKVGQFDDTPPPNELAADNYSTELFGCIVYHFTELCNLQPFLGVFGGVSFRHFKKPILSDEDIQEGNYMHNYFGAGFGVKFFLSKYFYIEQAFGLGIKSAHYIPSTEFFAYKPYFLQWVSVGVKI